jgi:hypothetical protein
MNIDELEKNLYERSWPYLRYYPGIRLEKPRKTKKTLIQDSSSPRQKIEPRTSGMPSRSINLSTTTIVISQGDFLGNT